MTTRSLALTVCASSLFAVAGCELEGTAPGEGVTAEATGTVASASTVPNGRELNGRELNGRELNGRELNGRELNGRELNGRELNGRELNGESLDGLGVAFASTDGIRLDGRELRRAELDGTWLEARDARGRRYAREDFEGARLDGVLDDGRKLPLRIDSIHPHQGPGGGDAHAYAISFRTDAGWEPYCGTDARGRPVKAIPLAGRWNYRQGMAGGGDHLDDAGALTFACEGFVLAKCVGLGYRPWAEARGVELAEHHQACTRLMRADYCGDGTPHTVNGVAVNVYDAVGLQRDTKRWAFEAEWTAGGARCVAQNRQGPFPACAASLRTAGCGARANFRTGTLLMSEDRP